MTSRTTHLVLHFSENLQRSLLLTWLKWKLPDVLSAIDKNGDQCMLLDKCLSIVCKKQLCWKWWHQWTQHQPYRFMIFVPGNKIFTLKQVYCKGNHTPTEDSPEKHFQMHLTLSVGLPAEDALIWSIQLCSTYYSSTLFFDELKSQMSKNKFKMPAVNGRGKEEQLRSCTQRGRGCGCQCK